MSQPPFAVSSALPFRLSDPESDSSKSQYTSFSYGSLITNSAGDDPKGLPLPSEFNSPTDIEVDKSRDDDHPERSCTRNPEQNISITPSWLPITFQQRPSALSELPSSREEPGSTPNPRNLVFRRAGDLNLTNNTCFPNVPMPWWNSSVRKVIESSTPIPILRLAFWLIPRKEHEIAFSQLVTILRKEVAPVRILSKRCRIGHSAPTCAPDSLTDPVSTAQFIHEQVEALVSETIFEDWVEASLFGKSHDVARLEQALNDLRLALIRFYTKPILSKLAEQLKDCHPLAYWASTYSLLENPTNLREMLINSVINPIRSVMEDSGPIISKLKCLAILSTRYNELKPFIGRAVLSTEFNLLSKLETEDIDQLAELLIKQDVSYIERIINAAQVNTEEIVVLHQKRIDTIAWYAIEPGTYQKIVRLMENLKSQGDYQAYVACEEALAMYAVHPPEALGSTAYFNMWAEKPGIAWIQAHEVCEYTYKKSDMSAFVNELAEGLQYFKLRRMMTDLSIIMSQKQRDKSCLDNDDNDSCLSGWMSFGCWHIAGSKHLAVSNAVIRGDSDLSTSTLVDTQPILSQPPMLFPTPDVCPSSNSL